MQKILRIFLVFIFLTFIQGCTLFGGGGGEDFDDDDESYSEEEEEGDVQDDEAYETVEEDPESEGTLEEEAQEEEEEEEEEEVYYIDEEDEEDELYGEENVEIEDDEEDSGEDYQVSDEGGGDYDYSETSGEESTTNYDTATVEQSTAGEVATSSLSGGGQNIPLRKIRTSPYNRGGYLANAVYIARPGDNLSSISLKIFNSTQQEQQLSTLNPHLSGKDITVGDKIYYQSPNRPQDASNLLFYYQDIGANPEYHSIQAGEDIRKVSYNLLGHPKSWKEIWATNPDIVSKGSVETPLNLQYWPDGVSIPPATSPPPGQVEGGDYAQSPPMEENLATGEEVLPNEGTDFPPPDSSFDQEADMGASSPPPPTEENNFPPPSSDEPPSPTETNGMAGATGTKTDFFKNLSSRTDLLVAGALGIIGILGVVAVVRKRKKKEFDFTAGGFQMSNVNEDED